MTRRGRASSVPAKWSPPGQPVGATRTASSWAWRPPSVRPMERSTAHTPVWRTRRTVEARGRPRPPGVRRRAHQGSPVRRLASALRRWGVASKHRLIAGAHGVPRRSRPVPAGSASIHRLNPVERGSKEQLRAIDESKAKAQRYLDRIAPKSPQHLALPSAHWHETGTKLSVAEPGQPRCGAKAIDYAQPVMSYGLSLVPRNPASCIRPRGHDGQHASEVIQHVYRKSLWKAMAWD